MATDSYSAVVAHLTAVLRDPTVVVRYTPSELDFTVRVVRRARLLGRLAWKLREAGLSEALPICVRDALDGALALADAEARQAMWELDRLTWALRTVSTPLIALKGCAYLVAKLPNASGRLLSDVDVLVPEQRLREVEAQLTSQGWRAAELTPYDEHYYRVWMHELAPMRHWERDLEVDLHHNVTMRTARLQPNAPLLIQGARAIPDSGFSVLAPIDMVLHAMTHLFYGTEIDDTLRDFVDIHDLLLHWAAHEPGFWTDFWPRAVELNLARPAFYGLRYVRRLLGTPIPPHVLEASRAGAAATPVIALMDRLVPRAAFPPHPDEGSAVRNVACLALYARAHWARMPPFMLARHLTYKFYVTKVRGGKRPLHDAPA